MNTISTKSYRDKYRLANFDVLLRNALIAEKVCMVDRTDAKTIQSPYGSQPTVTVQAIAGTYSTAAYTLTDSTLTVADEFIVAEHVYDWEETLTMFDVFANRVDEQAYAAAAKIDNFVLNALALGGTGAYTTPTGGFTTAANINVILSNLASKVMGYSEAYKGMYLVIESTDVPGFMQAQMTNGFSFADAALKNGLMTSQAGIEIYVAPAGTFTTGAVGTLTFANSGCRLFGVKQLATYAAPRGVRYEEKGVAGKTGKEIVTFGYIGVKVWGSKAGLTVKITLA